MEGSQGEHAACGDQDGEAAGSQEVRSHQAPVVICV